MKKLNKEISKLDFITKMEQSLKKDYLKALKDKEFNDLVSKIPLVDEALMKYTTSLQASVNELKNCKTCSHLLECKNEVKGFIYTPEADGKRLIFSYHACPYQKKAIKANKYQENMFYFDVPIAIKEAKMANIFTNDKKRKEIIKWLKNFINNHQIINKGLYLHGNFGSGKTYLIAAMFNELAKRGERGAIIYWSELLRDLKASFNDDFAEKYNYIKKIPFLLIDDLGAENNTSWSRDEILGPLLQYRMEAKLNTFFTSNLGLEELENHFSKENYKTEKLKSRRIIERIKQLTDILELVSKNNREND